MRIADASYIDVSFDVCVLCVFCVRTVGVRSLRKHVHTTEDYIVRNQVEYHVKDV